VLHFQLTPGGSAKFRRLTRDLARRGARIQTVPRFVIEIDGRVFRRIRVDYRFSPDGLDASSGLVIAGMPLSTARRLGRGIRAA
jgi:hypothetical protein